MCWLPLTCLAFSAGVVVLGPQVPDYHALVEALALAPGRLRAIGIPFGQTESQARQAFELQVQAGVSGLRVQPEELQSAPWLLDALGERGLWLYMINWIDHPDLYPQLLSWLERYPAAHLGAPHFLQPHPLPPAARDVLRHPRFMAIFSRHGGMGSRLPYPHADLLPWVEEVIALTGWERVLWGSEYPVFYWRGESLPACRDWLSSLLPDLPAAFRSAYLGGNAARLFFNTPPPTSQPVTFPTWIERQFDRRRSVPLFQGAPLDLPMEAYARLHHRFVSAQQANPSLTFAEFVADLLSS
jgi:hypothetical protein